MSNKKRDKNVVSVIYFRKLELPFFILIKKRKIHLSSFNFFACILLQFQDVSQNISYLSLTKTQH